MNSNFNYAGFIDMFLDSRDDYEPYGVADISDMHSGYAEPLEGHGDHFILPELLISPRR